ncbi:MAG: SDR family oxidoreductase [Deltaproteobacteria bacterium]|nr:SDR family oxidoreductase [Deltaproteobacteria bacterium]
MGQRLENKIAIITGGTSGIGEATAEVFAAEGAKVIISGRSEQKGADVAARLGENVIYQHVDIMNEQDIKAVIDLAVSRFGRLDILFNNAGGPSRGDIETVTADDFAYSMNLILRSVVFGIKHAAPVMKQQGGGSIINNASIAAHRTHQGGYLYSVAKAGMVQLTKVAGEQLGPFGIRVNCISPGAIATPIFWGGSAVYNALTQEQNERKMAKLQVSLAKATPIPRSGLAKDIAYGALLLASDEGSFINCHDLVIDGGRTSLFRD